MDKRIKCQDTHEFIFTLLTDPNQVHQSLCQQLASQCGLGHICHRLHLWQFICCWEGQGITIILITEQQQEARNVQSHCCYEGTGETHA